MRFLVREIKKNGYTYRCILRGLKAFVYSQNLDGQIIGYETLRRKVNKAFEVAGCKIEEGEAFPSNESFGKWAWSYKTYEDASKKYQEIEHG